MPFAVPMVFLTAAPLCLGHIVFGAWLRCATAANKPSPQPLPVFGSPASRAGIGLLRPSGHIFCIGLRSHSAPQCLQSPHLIRIYLAHTSPGNLLSHLSHFVTPRKYALLTFFTILLSLYMQPIGH